MKKAEISFFFILSWIINQLMLSQAHARDSALLAGGISWIGLHKNLRPLKSEEDCESEELAELGLHENQVPFCRKNLDFMSSVVRSAEVVIKMCEDQMSDRRWNCSSIRRAPNFWTDLIMGRREQAFVYALSSAALTYQVAQDCTSGKSTKCRCAPLPAEQPRDNFKWSGCGGDIEFARKFSQGFLEAPMKGKVEKVPLKFWKKLELQKQLFGITDWFRKKVTRRMINMMNAHNVNTGRLLVENSLETQCKCHGVSGSCSLKTCWKGLRGLTPMAAKLKQKYLEAVMVEMTQIGNRKQLLATSGKKRLNNDEHLVYVTESPDYCNRDIYTGSVGTNGRLCSPSSSSQDSCEFMCCGRGFVTRNYTQEKPCRCKFHHCCYVQCDTCVEPITEYRCR